MNYNDYMLNQYYAEQELSDKMEHLDIHDSADYADYLADIANERGQMFFEMMRENEI